jgi:hypothetical protein
MSDQNPLAPLFDLIATHAAAAGCSSATVAARVLRLIIAKAEDPDTALDDANEQLEAVSLAIDRLDMDDDMLEDDE